MIRCRHSRSGSIGSLSRKETVATAFGDGLLHASLACIATVETSREMRGAVVVSAIHSVDTDQIFIADWSVELHAVKVASSRREQRLRFGLCACESARVVTRTL